VPTSWRLQPGNFRGDPLNYGAYGVFGAYGAYRNFRGDPLNYGA